MKSRAEQASKKCRANSFSRRITVLGLTSLTRPHAGRRLHRLFGILVWLVVTNGVS